MEDQRQSGAWAGWVIFASVMMFIVGAFQIIAGVTALSQPESLTVSEDRLLVFDFTVWGWIHIVWGVLVIFAGIALRSGATWARVVGIVLASVSAIQNLAWVDANPYWAVLTIVLDIVVIYALSVHGRALADDTRDRP